MAEIEEFPVRRELTATEAASYAERRGATGGIVIFFDKEDREGFCSFGSMKNKDILWLLEKQKLVSLNQAEVDEI